MAAPAFRTPTVRALATARNKAFALASRAARPLLLELESSTTKNACARTLASFARTVTVYPVPMAARSGSPLRRSLSARGLMSLAAMKASFRLPESYCPAGGLQKAFGISEASATEDGCCTRVMPSPTAPKMVSGVSS
jgi:hypothetical protein